MPYALCCCQKQPTTNTDGAKTDRETRKVKIKRVWGTYLYGLNNMISLKISNMDMNTLISSVNRVAYNSILSYFDNHTKIQQLCMRLLL